jgi:Ca2+-binding RTX toxin-like protein
MIYITAEYINLNGLLQSGKDTYDLTLGAATIAEISTLGTAGGLVELTNADVAGGDFIVRYNTGTRQIEVDDLRTGGGYIDLTGHILNTGNGVIRVLGGYPEVNITNNTSYDLVTYRIDNSQPGSGTLIIKDKAKTPSAPGGMVTTIYQQTAGGPVVKSEDRGSGGVVKTDITSYTPEGGWRYGWSVGVETFDRYYKHEDVKAWIGIDWLAVDPETIEWDTHEVLDVPAVLKDGPYYFKNPSMTSPYTYNYEYEELSGDFYIIDDKVETTWYGESTYHNEVKYESRNLHTYTHTIKADRPINVQFIGGTEGSVDVDANGDVVLRGPILNPSGTTKITAGGEIRQETDEAYVTGKRIELEAATGIGAGSAIRTDVSDGAGAGLKAVTNSGRIQVSEIAGSLPVDQVKSAHDVYGSGGQVTLTARDSIVVASGKQGLVEGGAITLITTTGGIGSASDPLNLDSGVFQWDKVNVDARGDVHLKEMNGNLNIESIVSTGDVHITVVNGGIVDANEAETRDERTYEQLKNGVWHDLRLTGDGALAKIQEAKDSLAALKEQEYRQYWIYRNGQGNPSVYDPEFQVSLSAAEQNYYRTKMSYGDSEIEGLETSRTAQYHTLHVQYGGYGNTYDPTFSYTLTADENAAIEGSIHVYTEQELLYTVSTGLLKNIADTQATIEEPNIMAPNVFLTTSAGVGKASGVTLIDVSGGVYSLSDDDRVALAAAERTDVAFLGAPISATVNFNAAARTITRTDGGNWVTDGFADDMRIHVSGSAVNNTGVGEYYLIDTVNATVITLASASDLTTESGKTVTITPEVNDPTAPGVVIKTIVIDQREDVDLEITGKVDVRAQESVYLGSEQNNININLVRTALDKDIRIKSGQGIANVASSASAVNVIGGNTILEAASGSIGTEARPINTDLGTDATITGRAKDDIYIVEKSGNMNLEFMYAETGGVYLIADGSILDALDTDFTKIAANHVRLTALNGAIGEDGDYIDIEVAGAGTIVAYAHGSIWLSETFGNMNVEHIQSNIGNVDLKAHVSILDGNGELDEHGFRVGDADADVIGNSITLTALLGGIGVSGNDLDIDSRFSGNGVLTSSSNYANTYIIETTGDVYLNTVGTGDGYTAFITAPTGSILNGRADGGSNVASGKTYLVARDNIGEETKWLRSEVGNIEGKSILGSAWVINDGALTEGGVVVVTGEPGMWSGGDNTVTALSPITITEDVIAVGDITRNATEHAGEGDDITIKAGVTIKSTGGGTITFNVGDNFTLEAGAVIMTSGDVVINADYGNLDPGIGSIISIYGEIYANQLIITGAGDKDYILNYGTIHVSNTINIYGEDTADEIVLTGTIFAKEINIFSGSGDDIVMVTGNINVDSFTIDTGTGDDQVIVSGTLKVAGLLTVTTGDGMDFFTVTDTGIIETGAMIAHTGSEADTIWVDGSIKATGTISFETEAGTDVVTITGSVEADKFIINTGDDDDVVTIDINYDEGRRLVGYVQVLGGDGDDLITVNKLHSRTAVMDLDGQGGSDTYIINTSGSLSDGFRDYVVNVLDTGAKDDGIDTLTINGTDDPDVFLLRRVNYIPGYDYAQTPAFVALLHGTIDEVRKQVRPDVERINYDENINARLTVNGLGGDDWFISDDNATITTLDGGEGDDYFQIGQIFGEQRIFDYVAEGDQFDTIRTTRGYLSNGISFPTVVYGGTGDDTFTVYANRAELRLEGQDGDDLFVIRAFALADEDFNPIPDERFSTGEEIEARPGEGYDVIQYNINAPVDIDGGRGFDKIVILGTEFDDNFVLTDEGVFGAGLHIRFENVEAIEIDGLEGNDRFYVLSTRAGMSSTIIGGLGSDVINIGGDVTAPIVSLDLEGRSGVINHQVTSTADAEYHNLLAPGIQLNVADPSSGQIVIEQSGGSTVVYEDGETIDSYTISLAAAPTAAVFVNVSAVRANTEEQELGAATVLVSVDNGVTWKEAGVVRFDAGETGPKTVMVKAIDDTAAEGDRLVMVSHSSHSEDADFNHAAIKNVRVLVVDNDQPGVVITESGAGTLVLEGEYGITDDYTVKLAKAPAAGETVTLTLDFDMSQLSLTSDDTRFSIDVEGKPQIVFNHLNWSNAVSIEVKAVDDGARENRMVIEVAHVVTSTDSDYVVEDTKSLMVTVLDDDTPGVLLTESDGTTLIVKGESGDSYDIRLTKAPEGEVQVHVLPDGQVLVSSDDDRFDEETRTITFDETNWHLPVTVNVVDNPDFEPDEGEQPLKVFPMQPHQVGGIQGPLEVIGGVGDADRSLKMAVILPTEFDSGPRELHYGELDELDSIDVLNVFNDGSLAPDLGVLTEDNLFISGMGPGVSFESSHFGTIELPAGISYSDIEVLEIMLGQGNDLFTVESTLRTDGYHGGITVIHGGGGGDTIIVNRQAHEDGGDSALVVFGDTSQDGSRYAGVSGVSSPLAISFTYAGNDVIDARNSNATLAIYGGAGNDIIYGSQAGDHLAGGSGDDTIYGEGGNDHIYGDSGINVDVYTRVITIPTENRSAHPNSDDLQPGDDTIHGGDGDDIIFGDHGVIEQTEGTLRVLNTGNVARAYTVNPDRGGDDTIHGDDGEDIIFGGYGNDTIRGGRGDDILIGDSGLIDYDTGDGDIATIDLIATTDPLLGGDDTIYGGDGNDIILGGQGGDTIEGNDGNIIVIGDNGKLTYGNGFIHRIETTDFGIGGEDIITTRGGNDIVFGGHGGDIIDVGDGNNIVLGDDGLIDYVVADGDPSDIDLIDSLSTTTAGGPDTITSGSGQDIIIGGRYGDTIHAGAGDNLVIGDSGRITAANSEAVRQLSGIPMTLGLIESIEPADGGNDTIATLDGKDIIIGGQGGDFITAGAGDDIVIGDNGLLNYDTGDNDPTTLDFIKTTYTPIGGADTIYGNEGEDVLIGGAAGDRIDGGSGDDLIFGDNVRLERKDDYLNPRFRALQGTQLYGQGVNVNGYPSGEVLVTGESQLQPGGPPVWGNFVIELLDHSAEVERNPQNRFGDDYIAGGAGNDTIFGQLGNDVIQGDGSIDGLVYDEDPVYAYRDEDGYLQIRPSFDSDTDGDDYIEGGGGKDVIFGNLGQDDIIGGSSNLFGLTTPEQRPDGGDMIFGGSGTRIERNVFVGSHDGNYLPQDDDELISYNDRHALDSDMILGDNGNIYRIVGTNGTSSGAYLTFNYDALDPARGDLRIIPRAAELLDYTPGGPDWDPAALARDIGGGDEIHGESGDDFLYGMTGNDVIIGGSEDDDIIGGWGHDWISGGTGDDGILGDDGRIFTSRNSSAYGEPLNGIAPIPATELNKAISTPGNIQQAIINIAGELKKSVDLTPFNPVRNGHELSKPNYADDIIYGGLGSDWLHGGAGDDAISGAEALPLYYERPFNPGNVLRYNPVTGEFAEYDEYEPRKEIFYARDIVFSLPGGGQYVLKAGDPFILNFDPPEGPDVGSAAYGKVQTDGDDKIFGDLGNDWLVGGTGRDHMYGGWGDDLINADDDHRTNGGLNDRPDTHPGYEDIVYGGAGRDRLIGNTGGDRLIDWAGEFNSYIVPFAPFGMGTVSRTLQPQLAEYLYALSASDGADFTRAADAGGDPARRGEPYGELGLVRQQDFAWRDQTGAPDDPQPGNIPGGRRDVLRSASFDDASATGFFADSGVWTVQGGALKVSAESLGGDAVSVFHVGDALPVYFEVQASVLAVKPTAGWKANSYIIFDYQSEEDFKFVGLDVSTNKLVMGHRDASGWHVDVQGVVKGGVKADKWYNLLLSVNGLTATLIVDNQTVLTHTYQPRVIDGYAFALNNGFIGVGSDNSRGAFDNIRVQVLPQEITLELKEDFSDGKADFFTNGAWSIDSGRYVAGPGLSINLIDLGVSSLSVDAFLDLSGLVSTDGRAGFVFDYYSPDNFKFAAIDAPGDKVLIGHYTAKSGWVIDASASKTIKAGSDYNLGLTLKGSTISVTLDGQAVVAHAFNAVTVDGRFGLMTGSDGASFDNVVVKTSDRAFQDVGVSFLMAASAPVIQAEELPALTYAELDSLIDASVTIWIGCTLFDEAMLNLLDGLTFVIADLTGEILALTVGNTVLIDIDAAGHGWFIDPTPYQNSEFKPQNNDEELVANETGPASGYMDLLTVVMHELGHVFGFGDIDSSESTTALMSDTLDEGVRRLPVGSSGKIENSDTLISLDFTPDESAAEASLSKLISINPWLTNFLVNGAYEDVHDPNRDICIVLDSGDDEGENPLPVAPDTAVNNGKGKKK